MVNRLSSIGCIQKFFQARQRFGHVLARKAQAEVIAGVAVHRSGQEQYTAFVDEFIAKGFYIAGQEFWEGNRPGFWTNPRKTVAVAGEKVVEQD